MSATVRQAGIRLSLQGAQEVTRGLREIGDAGERNLGRVTREAGAAAAALRLLGPILGGLGAGLGIGSLVGMAQSYITNLATEMLGLRDNTDEVRRAAEAAMTALRDEGNAVQRNVRSIDDLLKTAAERAADLARAQRENLRLDNMLRTSNAIQMQDAAASALPEAERELARIQQRLGVAQAEQALARRARGTVPQDEASGANAALFSAMARVEGLRAEMALQSRRIAELQAARDTLANLPPVDVRESGASAGGARAAADTTGRDVAREIRERQQEVERITQAYEAYNRQINLQNAGLERAGPVLDAYAREMQNLENFLRLGLITQTEFEERVRLSSEALGEQMEQAQRAGQAVSGLSRETSRFAASAASDFARAVIAGKSLADTLSNILSRLGDLLMNRAFDALFGNLLGGVFSGVFGGIFGGGSGGGGSGVGASLPWIAGQRANGGPVEAGRPYLVGERGPEVFVPRQSGGVMANGQGGGVVINQTMSFGSDVNRATLAQWGAEVRRQTMAAIEAQRMESRRYLA